MPGTLIFKPIQCQLTHPPLQSKIHDAYIVTHFEGKDVQTHRSKLEGDKLVWDKDKNILEVQTGYEKTIRFDILDASKKEPLEKFGDFRIDLDILETAEHSTEWYDVYDKNKIVGKVLMESKYLRDESVKRPNFTGTNEKTGYVNSLTGLVDYQNRAGPKTPHNMM